MNTGRSPAIAWACFIGIGVGLLAILAVVSRAIDGMSSESQYEAACTRVLECLDAGATREQCDLLFPRCGGEP